MAIKAYVGRMGSGKTYEVTSVVILGALRAGRRVVSNIAGLNYDAMQALLIEQGVAPEKIGTLFHVEHAQVNEPNFWRTDKDTELGIDAVIQPGDLLALDEIWRFSDGFTDRKMSERVMNFFRMHRHFVHPVSGLSCEVAIITQDVMDIGRKVRAVIEETFMMTKLTAIGSSKRYRIDIFQGGKTSRKPLRSIQRQYEPIYFPLYSSHSQKKEGDAEAKEENIDKRGNILSGAMFKVVLPIGFVVLVFAVMGVWKFLHPKPQEVKLENAVVPANGITSTAAASPAKPQGSAVSDHWRSTGYVETSSRFTAVVSDGAAVRMIPNPRAVIFVGRSHIELALPDGQIVTAWSGASKSENVLLK